MLVIPPAHLCVFCLLCLYCQLLLAIRCGRCDPTVCRALAPEECPGGVTKDMCDCCPVCAKHMNESCGGPYGLLGKCGTGLECALTSKIGGRITGDEVGICREKVVQICDNVTCKWPYGLQCPHDSIILVTEARSSCCNKKAECMCNSRTCVTPTCSIGEEPVVISRGTNAPGSCCDQYTCQKTELCKTRRCPIMKKKKCPKDSMPLPQTPTPDGCCFSNQGCECKVCPEVKCPKGLHVHIHTKAKHVPGHCCASFVCVNESTKTCRHEGKEYKDGSLWQPDQCTKCQCRLGITFCKVDSCVNVSLCPYMEIPDGACCHVCKGCVTENGLIKKNGESWKDECKVCRCVEGETQCSQHLCETHCAKPKYIPGKCCPVCDNDSQGPTCSFPHTCKKDCVHGYVKGEDGCPLCLCNKCPSLDGCLKRCRYGFHSNEQGCQICKCRDLSVGNGRPNETNITPNSKPPTDVLVEDRCLTQGGHLREEGEIWHDGCRKCLCHNGREMCSLVVCPKPGCSNPVFRMGDCCPRCLDSVTEEKSHREGGSCKSLAGLPVSEGESWNLDNCTSCLCHKNSALCQRLICPPLLCSHPEVSVDKCCPYCSDDILKKTDLSAPRTNCYSGRGDMYEEGEVWKTTPCQTCACTRGQIKCFSVTCSPPSCNNTVLLKGDCCPTCLFVPKQSYCTSREGVTYSEGEQWNMTGCSVCQCIHGIVQCSEVKCEIPRCKYLVKHLDSCCPVCMVPEASMSEGLSVTSTAIICVLSVTMVIVVTLSAIFIYRLRQGRHSADHKLNEAARLNNTHVQLLGYQKGDNQDKMNNDSLDIKAVNENLLPSLEKTYINNKDDVNNLARVSFYDVCDNEG